MIDGPSLTADLLKHGEWADALVWSAVHRVSRNDERLTHLLRHYHTVQWAFLGVWRGKVDEADFAIERDLEALEQWARQYHREAAAAASELQFDRQANVPWAEHVAKRYGIVHAVTIGETLVQVAMHSQYHRGQVNARIRDLGADPPLIDFIMWLWLGRPAPAWKVRTSAAS